MLFLILFSRLKETYLSFHIFIHFHYFLCFILMHFEVCFTSLKMRPIIFLQVSFRLTFFLRRFISHFQLFLSKRVQSLVQNRETFLLNGLSCSFVFFFKWYLFDHQIYSQNSISSKDYMERSFFYVIGVLFFAPNENTDIFLRHFEEITNLHIIEF